MPRKSDRKRDRSTERLQARRRVLLFPVLALLIVAIASAIYLAYLYVQVRLAPGGTVSSFCSISENVDCVSVAASAYATFLGLPVAFYALEYFALALSVVVLSGWSVWRLRSWDSVLFSMMLVALPISIWMAYVSVARIRSLCLMCTAVYATNVLLLLLLAIAHRDRLRTFLAEGPRELLHRMSSNAMQIGATVLIVVAVSQFFWVPGLLPRPAAAGNSDPHANPWKGLPVNGMSVGSPDAPVKIDVFSDFQCPSCARLHRVMLQVVRRLSGRVQLTHHDYPLDEACNRKITRPIHQFACNAAHYARCAAEQGRFWHFESVLFANQHRLDTNDLEQHATAVGLDLAQLKQCVKRPHTRQAVLQDIEEGIRRDVRGTPTFFINGKQVSDPRIVDASFWEQTIEGLLAGR